MIFRHRMPDVDEVAQRLVRQSYRADAELIVHDRAESTRLTPTEWAEHYYPSSREYNFKPQVFCCASLAFPCPADEPTLRSQAADHFGTSSLPSLSVSVLENYDIRLIIWMPPAQSYPFQKTPSYSIGHNEYRIDRSVVSILRHSHLARTIASSQLARIPFVCEQLVNILSLACFPTQQLIEGIQAAFNSFKHQSLWIVGCTDEECATNRVTFFRRTGQSWGGLERIADGSKVEKFVASDADGLGNNDR